MTELKTITTADGGKHAAAGQFATLQPALMPSLLTAIKDHLNFTFMTPVQSATIPLARKRHADLVVEAVTGSGKTLAYVLPLLERVWTGKDAIVAIVIAPTRELAKQVHNVVMELLQAAASPELRELGCHLLIGGDRTLQQDISSLKEATTLDIIVGTPGRLWDCIQANVIPVNRVDLLVLDEADRLLDMGFGQTLSQIMSKLPKQRRTSLFSATMTDALQELVRAGLRNPLRVVVKVEQKNENESTSESQTQRTPSTLSITYVLSEPEMKLSALIAMLLSRKHEKVIVYMATCACVDYFYRVLSAMSETDGPAQGLKFYSLHGKMVPKRRTAVYDSFVSSEAGILLCTDVAARGLDLPDIDRVIQYDAPQDPKAFVHRCGRTARQGRYGAAVLMLAPHEDTYVNFLRVRQVPIEAEALFGSLGQSLVDDTAEENVRVDGYATVGAESAISDFCNKVDSSLLSLVTSDRDLFEKSTMAFVSYIRFYQEHQASFIFPFAKLDLSRVARSFCLLQMPRMPELRQRQITYEPPCRVDLNQIPYKDKIREKQRQKKLIEKQEKREQQVNLKRKKRESVPWSGQQERKEKRDVRREKRQARARYEKSVKEEQKMNKDVECDMSDDDLEEDWKALRRESRLLKKVKTGKLSMGEFEEACNEE